MARYTFVRLMHKFGYGWVNYTLRSPKVVVIEAFRARPGGYRRKIWRRVVSKERALRHMALLREAHDYRVSRRNPPEEAWTKIGEWWIDDSGNALYADGDNGDMGHEAYIIDMITRKLLDAMDIDPWNEEAVGDLNDGHNRKAILAKMKEEEFTGVIEEFVEEAAKGIWKDEKQREAAIDIADGRGDARKYGMQYDGWIRVAGHGFECWEMTAEVLKHMGDGVYDAGHEEIGPDEIFEIYVHKTGMYYGGVPWSVISEGDPGALRVYGTKNNPKRRRRG